MLPWVGEVLQPITKMKKTEELFKKYMKLLEQDQQDPMQDAPPEGEAPVPEAPPAPEPETIPLSSTAELRYIEDVLLAAQMPPPSGEAGIEIQNLLDLLKSPDAINKIQGAGMTATDLYKTKILPIIRPAQEGQDIRDLSDQMAQ